MNEAFNDIEQIEAFLDGKLSEQGHADFEKRLRTDAAFAQEVELFKDMLSGIALAGEGRIKQDLKEVEKKLEAKGFFDQRAKVVNMPRGMIRWLAVAASVAVIAVVAVYLYSGGSSASAEKGFANYYQPENAKLPGILDRLEASGLADAEKAKDEALASALQFYEKGDFEGARAALDEYLGIYPDEQVAQMYMGLSLLHLSDYAQAANFLAPLSEDDTFDYTNTAKWYLALCYAKLGSAQQLARAKTLLENLSADLNSGYHEEASAYLEYFK